MGRETGWSLSSDALERLLCALAPDRERAGEIYEALRRKLVSFFEWRGASSPEDLADEVFNRIARKLESGEEVRDAARFALGVARLVLLECKPANRAGTLPEDIAARGSDALPYGEADLAGLDRCLEQLPPADRELILEYYRFDRREKIKHRQALADRLGIPINALRIRAHRVRAQLERCLQPQGGRRK